MSRAAAVMLLALLSCAALATPAPGAEGPVDFEQRVPAWAAGAGAVGVAASALPSADAYVSPPLRAPLRFDLLGLRWRGGHAHVELRVRRVDGRWSRWIAAPHGEDAPRGRGGGTVSGPVWTGGATHWQVRSERPLRGLRAHFVAVPRPAAAPAPAHAPSPPARTATDRPAIVPRAQWDPTNACVPRTTPRYGRVDFAFVHHTESLTSYSPAESAAVVLAICRFHRNGNGWFDIGYNLLVDRFGTVFEGRAGGVEEPVIGAQAGGWNSMSTGVAMIGSFSRERPGAAAQASLERVLAWKLALAGVPALGAVTETSLGGDENRWSRGARVRFQRVSGHRDGDQTDCPGAALYALLPQLRGAVEQLHEIPDDLLTISPVGGALGPGGPAQVTGRLALADGRRPVGARLALQALVDGEWSDVGALRTGADGAWATATPVSVNETLRVVAPDRELASPAVRVLVRAGVTARVSPQVVRVGAGRDVRVSGATTPAKPRVSVLVERQTRSGGAWREVRRTSVATDAAGAYELTLTPTAAGILRFTVTTAADAENAAGVAPVRTALVLRAQRPGRGDLPSTPVLGYRGGNLDFSRAGGRRGAAGWGGAG